MVSFITISRSDEKVGALNKNINTVFNTGGYELLVADGNVDDIFIGYNRMAEEAKGEHLIFLHDDVKILANRECFDKPLELMDKPFTGIIGCAGATVMEAEGCWWRTNNTNCRGAVYHPNTQDTVFGMHLNPFPHMTALFGRVVVVDGVLMMMSKRTFRQLCGFFENGYNRGFHFYDLDISIRAHLAGLANYVAPVPLLHQSYGGTSEEWENNRKLFVDRYKKHLPLRL